MSPGPSLAVVIRNNINYNRLSGIMTSIGHGLGIALYATVAVLGLGFILQANQTLFTLIQILGLIFLFFLGLLFIFQKQSEVEINSNQNQFNSFLQGFLIAIINPKIIIWFTAIYSQFISIEASITFNLILILTASIIDAIWYIIVSFIVTSYGIKSFLINKKKLIQKITGFILLIISLSFLYNIFN
jgi:threonine/homoserine/homoserine lactone efflux protein